MYTIEYFIEKFEKIPENKWCVDVLGNHLGQRCAQGHCMRDAEIKYLQSLHNKINLDIYIKTMRNINKEVRALNAIFGEDSDGLIIAQINNSDHNDYTQYHPKQRVLAALKDLLKQKETESVVNSVCSKHFESEFCVN